MTAHRIAKPSIQAMFLNSTCTMVFTTIEKTAEHMRMISVKSFRAPKNF